LTIIWVKVFGDVRKRAREGFYLDFKFTKPIVALDSNSIRHLTIVPDRVVLLRGNLEEIFNCFLSNRFVYLKNKTIWLLCTIKHLKLCRLACNGFRNRTFTIHGRVRRLVASKRLQPVFEIANIRENSLAAKVVC
jgi:hypothetical protein